MALEMLDPITEADPCGPDLEAADDAEFLDYYYEAESRLPERYFTPGLAPDGREDRIFDPRSVDLVAEAAVSQRLLARSRDLRLFSLLARWRILAGRLDQFAASLEDIAAALEQWPEAVHPMRAGERRAALEALSGQTAVIMPLSHLPILSNADITLRRYMVMTGRAPARASEHDLETADLLGPLRTDANKRAVNDVHARLVRASEAVHRIRRAAAKAAQPVHPDLGPLEAVLAEMQAMIAVARPDLAPWSKDTAADITADTAAPEEAVVDPGPEAEIDAPPPAAAPALALQVADRAAAQAALDAAQTWLAINEPGSPALLLVAQSRDLVGLPLVEAIEMLLPEQAAAATLRIGHGSPFVLPMARLRALSEAGLCAPPPDARPPATAQKVAHRAALVSYLLGIERYFMTHEPSSPVPLLLTKARGMLDKRFDELVAELLVSGVEPDGG